MYLLLLGSLALLAFALLQNDIVGELYDIEEEEEEEGKDH